MNKYKVCVYAICKNEEKFVDRFMDSVSAADKVFVLDFIEEREKEKEN